MSLAYITLKSGLVKSTGLVNNMNIGGYVSRVGHSQFGRFFSKQDLTFEPGLKESVIREFCKGK